MISMRKQLFSLLICTGIITIILTSLAVNLTIREQFEQYIEHNIQKASTVMVEHLEQSYKERGDLKQLPLAQLMNQAQIGNFCIAILDNEKNLINGMTEQELINKVNALEYPLLYGRPLQKQQERKLTTKDLPIYDKDNRIAGYVRIIYFPSFLLSKDDILFQTNINRSIIGSGMIAIVCFILIGGYITRLVTKPIYAIAKTSVDLAEGKYTARYKKHSRIIELENLRYSMNYLAQKLEQQDTLRKKLISDVSHEIRTPLHILQSNLEAMIDGIYPIDDDQMEVLYQEVLRFGSLLNNLDKLKNIEEDRTTIKCEEMHINTCVKEVYNAFKIVAKERKIEYNLDIHITDRIMVLGDSSAIKQILMNILSNAFKFTKTGSIKVSTLIDGKKMFISVMDTGIGIAKDDLPYIFERMYRGDKSREQFEGSGIGLTIVKHLMLLHEGKIDIKSTEGLGTKVILELPIYHVHKASRIKDATIKD
ncbi:MAG: ATP-binding protein [Cellulosilyticaceae bacterium]